MKLFCFTASCPTFIDASIYIRKYTISREWRDYTAKRDWTQTARKWRKLLWLWNCFSRLLWERERERERKKKERERERGCVPLLCWWGDGWKMWRGCWHKHFGTAPVCVVWPVSINKPLPSHHRQPTCLPFSSVSQSYDPRLYLLPAAW